VFRVSGTPYGTVVYEIILRSTLGIYQFLGRIIRLRVQDTFEKRGVLKGLERLDGLTIARSARRAGPLTDMRLSITRFMVPSLKLGGIKPAASPRDKEHWWHLFVQPCGWLERYSFTSQTTSSDR
jgi:hypothetical protein